MGTNDSDRSIERLLEAAARARRLDAGAAGPSCLDAETIAAWSDGTLPAAEARVVELHLSTCMRCLETAAVFAKSAPPPLEPATPWWRRAHVRWLAPALAGAGALTLLIWTRGPEVIDSVTAPTQQQSSQQNEAVARQEPGREAAPAAPPAPTQPTGRVDEKSANTTAGARGQLEDRARLAKSELERQQRAQSAAADQMAASRDAAAAPKPIPAGPPVGAPVPTPQGVTLATPPPPPPPPPAAPAPPPPPAPRPQATLPAAPRRFEEVVVAENLAKTGSVVAEFSSPTDTGLRRVGAAGGRGGGAGRGGGRGGGAVQQAADAAPTTPVRWRVHSTGAVLKSVDGGRTWTQVAVDPTLQITGGAAPLTTVCWLIGRSGVVLLSTDGVTFTRTSLSIASDITSIRAQDELNATITTATGLTMTTSDGGKSWR